MISLRNLSQACRAADGALYPADGPIRRRRPPTERGFRQRARRVDGADAYPRLRATSVRLRPRRGEVEELGRLGRDRGPSRPGLLGELLELLPIPEARDVAVPCGGPRSRPPKWPPAMGGGACPWSRGINAPSVSSKGLQDCWFGSAGLAAPSGAGSRPRAAPSRPAGRRARVRGVPQSQNARRSRRQSLLRARAALLLRDDVLPAATTEPQLRSPLFPQVSHGAFGASVAMMVPHAPEARIWATALVQVGHPVQAGSSRSRLP